MKKYSIGETAKIMGLTTHTLRYWTNEGLITPEYVDPETGYRYYSFNQLHYVNRIKYLRNMDIPIQAIRDAIQNDSVESLIGYMKNQKNVLLQKMNELQSSIDEIEWYMDYFEHPAVYGKLAFPYIRSFGVRYAVSTDHMEGDTAEDMEFRVDELIGGMKENDTGIHRQWGYTFDYSVFQKGSLKPLNHFMFIRGESHGEHIISFPAGKYLCLMGPVKKEGFDVMKMAEKFSGLPENSIMLANEYETSFKYIMETPYEVQVYLGE